MLGVNGWEVILLVVLAVFILGPERLPEYAAKLAHGIRKLRVMAEGARGQLRDQLGPEYDDIDWRQYDPRQYDPRRIVRDALREPLDDAMAPIRDEVGSVRAAARGANDDPPVAADSDPPSPEDDDPAGPSRVDTDVPSDGYTDLDGVTDPVDREPAYSSNAAGAVDPDQLTPYDSDAT
ncbi:MAG: hypothetical protein ACRCXL_06860 [Dermatophilaceae bacterium]